MLGTLTMCETVACKAATLQESLINSHFFGAQPPAWDPLNNYHLFPPCSHSPVCVSFMSECVCICMQMLVCHCGSTSDRTLLAWRCQVRAGAYQAPATKEYGNEVGDKWIISCITRFSLPMYLATPPPAPMSLMISRMWQPETPAPPLVLLSAPLVSSLNECVCSELCLYTW